MKAEVPGEGSPELDIQTDEIPELLKTTDNFDRAQDAFLQACQDHAFDPCEETNEAIADCGNEVISSFRNSVVTFCNTLDDDESVRAIAALMVNDQMTRAQHIRNLTPSRKLGTFDKEGLLGHLQNLHQEADGVEDFADKVANSFARVMQKEVNIFTKKVYKRYLAQQALITTVTVSTDPLEYTPADPEVTAGKYYAFSIEPPIAIHDPEFIEDATLSFSSATATYGSIWVDTSHLDPELSVEETDEKLHSDLFERFNKVLNPLGTAALRVIWPRYSVAPETAEEEPASESEDS